MIESKIIPKYVTTIEATPSRWHYNQRRMEMETPQGIPAEYCLANPNDEAYCVFITTSL